MVTYSISCQRGPRGLLDLGLSAFELVEKMPALQEIQDLASAFYLSEATRGKTPTYAPFHPPRKSHFSKAPLRESHPPVPRSFSVSLSLRSITVSRSGVRGGNRTENTTNRTTIETRPACSKENQEKTHRKSAFFPFCPNSHLASLALYTARLSAHVL